MSEKKRPHQEEEDDEDEDDEDFVPEEKSESEEDGEGGGEEQQTEEAAATEETKKTVDKIWDELKTKTQTPKTTTTEATAGGTMQGKAETRTVTEVFEFAGEKVEVEKQVVVEGDKWEPSTGANAKKTGEVKGTTAVAHAPKRPGGGGGGGKLLEAILGPKPRKMSTLDKSKMDWDKYKRTQGQGLQDSLAKVGKSGKGFIETQAFLDRATQKQFEKEREAAKKK